MRLPLTALVSSHALTVAGCAPGNPKAGEADDFGLWDVDEDGYMNGDEFRSAWEDTFELWDRDDSGFIEQDEWDVGLGADGVEFDPDDFTAWDYDDDGLMSAGEFSAGAFDFMDEDRDARVDRNEWDQGIGVR